MPNDNSMLMIHAFLSLHGILKIAQFFLYFLMLYKIYCSKVDFFLFGTQQTVSVMNNADIMKAEIPRIPRYKQVHSDLSHDVACP